MQEQAFLSLSMEPSYAKDYNHLEQHVAKLLYKSGWTVLTSKQQAGYNLVIKKRNLVGAVQLKQQFSFWKNRVLTPILEGKI